MNKNTAYPKRGFLCKGMRATALNSPRSTTNIAKTQAAVPPWKVTTAPIRYTYLKRAVSTGKGGNRETTGTDWVAGPGAKKTDKESRNVLDGYPPHRKPQHRAPHHMSPRLMTWDAGPAVL